MFICPSSISYDEKGMSKDYAMNFKNPNVPDNNQDNQDLTI